MIRVNVQADIDGMLAQFDDIRDPRPAVSRAINKTLTTARAEASRAIIGAGYKIKSSDIKKRLSLQRASAGLLVGEIKPSGRPIPLINYGAKQTKGTGGGVSVNVLHGRKMIPGAFIATMPSGHKGVFVRVGSAAHAALKLHGKHAGITWGKSSYKHGLPIQELYGPGVPQAFANQVVGDAMVAATKKRFPVVLLQELKFLRSRATAQ